MRKGHGEFRVFKKRGRIQQFRRWRGLIGFTGNHYVIGENLNGTGPDLFGQEPDQFIEQIEIGLRTLPKIVEGRDACTVRGEHSIDVLHAQGGWRDTPLFRRKIGNVAAFVDDGKNHEDSDNPQHHERSQRDRIR